VRKAIKQRKGFTMLETVVSFAMFSVVLLLVLGTSYMSFNFSHVVANTAVDIAKTRSTVNYIQRTFESAQRMQYDDVVPSTATSAVVQSITFKRSAGASDYWTDLTVSGTALKSGNITLLNSASNILVDFYSPAGLLLASNHANVPVIPNFNDKGWEYYKVRYITMLNNDYFPITAVRKVSPYFEAPYVTDFTDSSRYTFGLPLDAAKKVGSLAVTYTSNSNIVNSNATASVINANINAFSSYLGIPAKKSAQITITPNPTASPFEAFPCNWVVTLTDKLTNTPITGATVYAYDSNGHFNKYITDENGSFRIGDYSGFSNTGIIFFYPGDETYAPATARN